MSEKNNNEVTSLDTASKTEKAPKAKNKPARENFFKRIWKKFAKLCKDIVGEMKKVVWTPKAELSKNTKLVIVTVVLVGVTIAVIDFTFSYLINSLAGLIG